MKISLFKLLLCSIMCFGDCFIPSNILTAIMDRFQVHHPIIFVNNFLTVSEQAKLFRDFSKYGVKISFNCYENMDIHQSYVVFSELSDFKWEIQTNAPVLVISRIANEADLSILDLFVDQEIYFIDWTSFEMYEYYTINELKVSKFLGKFRLQNPVEFLPAKDFNPLMIERRGNFHGLQLKGIHCPGKCINIK